jgi:7,8-dihydropterin-6-yl-methyl-4-(beta-D-ribofuranosyl)aminobenzene 5'-phosphate synthase
MEKGMNRRDFLKTTAAAGTMLLAGDLVQGVSDARAEIKIPEADKIMVTILTDNYSDINAYSHPIAQRFRRAPGLPLEKWALHAEHGLSYLVETAINGANHSFLFDFGSDSAGVLRNMEILNVDFNKLEALALSHGHWDHDLTFLDLMKAKKDKMREGIPLYVGEEAFIERFSRESSGKVVGMNQLRREDVEALGFIKIVEIKDPTSVAPGALFSGKIAMVTEYEKILPRLVKKENNEYVQDLFPGEQALIINLKGRGLIILSGCAHRGIVNAVKTAQRVTGIEKIHAVVGGFHLVESSPEVVQKTVADIMALSPNYIVPTHCTGFPAITAFAREMPKQFVLSSVGTRFTFGG